MRPGLVTGRHAMTEELNGLPLETRLLRYYELNEEALRRAETADGASEKARHIALAGEWRLLAEEAERVLRELYQRR